MPLRDLSLTEIITGVEVLTVRVDDTQQLAAGGYGAIFAVDGVSDRVVKRLDVEPPKPLTAIRDYTAHIILTRRRLQAIVDEEKRRSDGPRAYIVDFITEILTYSLSTHCGCDFTSTMQIGAVWLLQRRASGKSLFDHFRDRPAPAPPVRKRIAKHFLRRMRTLRRADLIHLDCVPENIFYDHATDRLTMIDLDGCGIVHRPPRRPAGAHCIEPRDEWEYPPVTLGHINSVRVPPWYPQPGVISGPKRGNFVFAERWVVLNTLIQILTWGKMNALAWLDDIHARRALGSAHASMRAEVDAFRTANGDAHALFDWWKAAWQEKLRSLAAQYRSAMPRQETAHWIQQGDPACMAYFADIAQQAFFEPQVLSTQHSPLYDVFSRQLG